MTISEAIDYYKEKTPKGEYVLVIEGAAEPQKSDITLEQAVRLAKELADEGIKPSDACKKIAKETCFSKSIIYAELIKNGEK